MAPSLGGEAPYRNRIPVGLGILDIEGNYGLSADEIVGLVWAIIIHVFTTDEEVEVTRYDVDALDTLQKSGTKSLVASKVTFQIRDSMSPAEIARTATSTGKDETHETIPVAANSGQIWPSVIRNAPLLVTREASSGNGSKWSNLVRLTLKLCQGKVLIRSQSRPCISVLITMLRKSGPRYSCPILCFFQTLHSM
jgi:hypothetical protein